MSFVFINCTADSFTPTKSGAIGTWIWEVCQVAQRDGVEPLVITRRRADAEVWPWGRTIELDYPQVPKIRGMGRVMDLQKRLLGWCHIRQHVYVRQVAEAIRKAGVQDQPLFLQNDIELAVYLRQQFPRARIVHHAQNNNPTSWRFRKAFARSVDLATAVTDFCADWNARYYGLKVETLLSGIDTDRFFPAEKQPDGPIVINFVGRTDHPKGPDLLLAAAARILRRTKNFSLQLLGSNHYDRFQMDDFQQRLTDMSRELESKGITIRRPGWITRAELPGELRKAHIHCIPARWDEPFGLTTLEGMACGLATVASRTGGTAQVVGDGAQLFDREQVDQLAGLLADLVESPRRRQKWADCARLRACELTWNGTWLALREKLQLSRETLRGGA